MTVEELVHATLSALAGGRVYPDLAPEGTEAPYIVYQQVGGQSLNHTEGSKPDAENCRIQVAVWGPVRTEVTALAQQVEALMRQAAGAQVTVLGNRTSVYEPDTALRGTRQDFSLWVPVS